MIALLIKADFTFFLMEKRVKLNLVDAYNRISGLNFL